MKKIMVLLSIFIFSCSSDQSDVEGNVQDFEAPIITLLGENPQILYINEIFEDLGAIANDNMDGDISNSIVVSNNVNVTQSGTYNVIYNVIDSSNNSAVATRTVEVLDPIVGTWTLTKEDWIADGTWPADQARGCFMTNDAGSPDQLIVTENNATKKVWECFQDGSLAVDLTVYGPVSWSNLDENLYSFDGENVEITFIDNNEMQMPIDGGQILQTWNRN
jgi:hypothetical protein